MGNSVSTTVKEMEKGQKDAEERMVSEVRQLTALLDAKEKEFRMKLINDNPNNKELPVDKIVKIRSEKRVDVSTAPSDKMTNLIEDMFGGSFLGALKGLILGALDTVLGNAQVGEKETTGFAVLLLHSAIVRVDYFCYAYTLRSDGVKTHVQNGMCFAVSLSTVRLQNTNSEVIALLSGMTAESSMAAQNFIANKMQSIRDNIKGNPTYYARAEAIGYISGYFMDSLKEPQEKSLDALNALKPDDADAQTAANKLLLELVTANSVEKMPERRIKEIQTALLETMTEIYDKIAKMKKATAETIAAADDSAPRRVA